MKKNEFKYDYNFDWCVNNKKSYSMQVLILNYLGIEFFWRFER